MHSRNRQLRIFTGICVLSILGMTALLVGAQTATPPPEGLHATAESLLRTGELYMVTPHPFQAAEYYSKALALEPENLDFYLRIARSYPDARSQIMYLNWGLEHLPGEGRLHLAVGHSLYSIYADPWQFERQSEFRTPEDALHDALLKYAVALALGAADTQLYSNLALLEEERGEWTYTAALYTAALGSNVTSYEPLRLYVKRGQAYLMLDLAEAAEADARAAIEIDGDYVDAWLLLGRALELQGDMDGAADAYQQHVTFSARQSRRPDAHAVEFPGVQVTPTP